MQEKRGVIRVTFVDGPWDGRSILMPISVERYMIMQLPDGRIVDWSNQFSARAREIADRSIEKRRGYYKRRVWRVDGHGSSRMIWQGWEPFATMGA